MKYDILAEIKKLMASDMKGYNQCIDMELEENSKWIYYVGCAATCSKYLEIIKDMEDSNKEEEEGK